MQDVVILLSYLDYVKYLVEGIYKEKELRNSFLLSHPPPATRSLTVGHCGSMRNINLDHVSPQRSLKRSPIEACTVSRATHQTASP